MLFSRMEHRMDIRTTATGRPHGLRSLILALSLVLSAGFVSAQSGGVELNPSHPDEYVVQKGDTLWDIAGRFLKDPWFWPEIWQVNQQIENPHLIYPGDLLSLVYVDGEPRLQLSRGGAGASTTLTGDSQRLSPRVREEDLNNAISTIPFSVIEAFLTGGLVLDKREAESLPYVVALRNGLVAGAGKEVYSRDLDASAEVGNDYNLYRIEKELINPDNNRVLGYEMLFVGEGELRQRNKDTDTIFLTDTSREVLRGDRLIRADNLPQMNFFPSQPDRPVDGQVISVIDGVALIGQFQMVIINRGSSDGLTEGSVLKVWQQGETVRDPVAGLIDTKVTLPDNVAGTVMVVKAYPEISYALVMEAQAEMRVYDRVKNP
jgi:hypothetical protein